MSERWEDPEDDFQPPEEFAKSLRVYTKVLEEYGLVSELTEYHVVNLAKGCAGTADRLYRTTKQVMTPDGEIHPVGTLFVGDLKTGKSLDFSLPGYCIQMALYAEGELYDVVNDEFLVTPPVNKDWGILVHMPASQASCELIWADLGAGEWGAMLVKQVKEWRKKWKNKDPYGAYEFTPPIAMSPEEVTEALDAEPVIDPEELVAWIKLRLAKLRKNEDAGVWLTRHWPIDVPGPRFLKDLGDIEQVLVALDKCEAEFGLTFPEGDPRGSAIGTYKTKEKKS